MRVLHTSDWHLGQHFMTKTREQEHRLFLEWLLKCVEEQQVDAIVIAGDIFDTGTPPSYARKLLNQFIVDLHKLGTGHKLVILGGNHDSVATLHESSSIFSCLNTYVIGAASRDVEEQVLILNDKKGNPGVVVCAVPYIRPKDVLTSRMGESSDQKEQALVSAMAGHYRSVYKLAEQQAKTLGVPVIATGHLTTVGGKLSESVREIYIGTLSAFPTDAFPPASYIALGHLHRAQKVANNNHIRYSGSPIPLSFDECSSNKQVLIVDFEGDQLGNINEIEVPRFRRLASLRGRLDVIESELQSLLAESSEFDLTPWIEVVVDAPEWISDLQVRVDQMATGLEVDVLRVRRMRQDSVATLTQEANETLDELDVGDVFVRRLEGVELDEVNRDRLMQVFQGLVTEIEEEQLSGLDSKRQTTRKYQTESDPHKESV